MNCVSCDICLYHVGLFVFFPRVFLSSRVTGACPVTTDLIMQDNVSCYGTQLHSRNDFFPIISILCLTYIPCFNVPSLSIP